MIYILSWTTKKNQKTFSRHLHSTLTKIQGLFKTVQTLRQHFLLSYLKPPPAPLPLGRPALIQLSEPDVNKAHSTQKRSTLAGNHPWRGGVTPSTVSVRTTSFFFLTLNIICRRSKKRSQRIDGEQVRGSRFSRGVG